MKIEKDTAREERIIVMALRNALSGKSAKDFDDICKEIRFRWNNLAHDIQAIIRKEFKDMTEIRKNVPESLAIILDRW